MPTGATGRTEPTQGLVMRLSFTVRATFRHAAERARLSCAARLSVAASHALRFLLCTAQFIIFERVCADKPSASDTASNKAEGVLGSLFTGSRCRRPLHFAQLRNVTRSARRCCLSSNRIFARFVFARWSRQAVCWWRCPQATSKGEGVLRPLCFEQQCAAHRFWVLLWTSLVRGSSALAALFQDGRFGSSPLLLSDCHRFWMSALGTSLVRGCLGLVS